LRKNLSEVEFEFLKGRSFDLINVTEMLCEVCKKKLGTKTKFIRKVQVLSKEDFQNLLSRGSVHDRMEVDVESGQILFFDHDFPGDIHRECVDKL